MARRTLSAQAQAAREDAAAARHLSAANGRDVAAVSSELRDFRQAANSSFNAMRDDLTELRTEMNTGFTEMRGKFDQAAAGQQQITELLNILIAREGSEWAVSGPSRRVLVGKRVSAFH